MTRSGTRASANARRTASGFIEPGRSSSSSASRLPVGRAPAAVPDLCLSVLDARFGHQPAGPAALVVRCPASGRRAARAAGRETSRGSGPGSSPPVLGAVFVELFAQRRHAHVRGAVRLHDRADGARSSYRFLRRPGLLRRRVARPARSRSPSLTRAEGRAAVRHPARAARAPGEGACRAGAADRLRRRRRARGDRAVRAVGGLQRHRRFDNPVAAVDRARRAGRLEQLRPTSTAGPRSAGGAASAPRASGHDHRAGRRVASRTGSSSRPGCATPATTRTGCPIVIPARLAAVVRLLPAGRSSTRDDLLLRTGRPRIGVVPGGRSSTGCPRDLGIVRHGVPVPAAGGAAAVRRAGRDRRGDHRGRLRDDAVPVVAVLDAAASPRRSRPSRSDQAGPARPTPASAVDPGPGSTGTVAVRQLTTSDGRVPGNGAPKEQPPRNLSGSRTVRTRQLWRAGPAGATAGSHRRGKPVASCAMSAGPVNLSGSATEGECAATAARTVAEPR